jgi:hypothetical protein
MIIKEFISETNKNKMISDLLKYYNVSSVKLKHKSMKDHAHFEWETGTLLLSTRYKTIKPRQMKEFLITIIHEIRHAIDARKYGWRKFKSMYEMQIAQYQAENPGREDTWYSHIEFENEAERFGKQNHQKWYNTFKKDKLF